MFIGYIEYDMFDIYTVHKEYKLLLINKHLELDLTQQCGKVVNFTLHDYEVFADYSGCGLVQKILDYFESRLNLKHKEDKGYYRSVQV